MVFWNTYNFGILEHTMICNFVRHVGTDGIYWEFMVWKILKFLHIMSQILCLKSEILGKFIFIYVNRQQVINLLDYVIGNGYKPLCNCIEKNIIDNKYLSCKMLLSKL